MDWQLQVDDALNSLDIIFRLAYRLQWCKCMKHSVIYIHKYHEGAMVYAVLPCRFRRQGIVFFVFLSSGNTSTANNFNISWLISTKLGYN